MNGSLRKPGWLNKKIVYTEEDHEVRKILHNLSLNTVCKSARCPNLSECYNEKRATFLILGDRCTRNCSFCSVKKVDNFDRLLVDEEEPLRIREAVKALKLSYVVITSVTRDDLQDKGASQFANTVRLIKELDKNIRVEVLTPDFLGDKRAIDTVAEAGPHVFNHNIETVSRLYKMVRPGADYKRSLDLLDYVREGYPEIFLKSGLMVGLGEREEEVFEVLKDLRNSGCNAVTIGQYLRPNTWNIPVYEYIQQEVFARYGEMAEVLGFRYVASAPYVRSSYMAHVGYKDLVKTL